MLQIQVTRSYGEIACRRLTTFHLVLIAAGLAVVFGSSTNAQPCGWQEVMPSARTEATMAFDSKRGVAVMFGGNGSSVSDGGNSETWEWNGTEWTLRARTGPPVRSNHAMAYDSMRGVVVLFGGKNYWQNLGDTWEWDGATWTLRSSSGPSARWGHAMAFDPVRGVTVLQGGQGQGVLNSTWEWDGTAWALRSTGGPGRRIDHAMTFDSIRGRVLLFGGLWVSPDQTSNEVMNDLWEWNPITGVWAILSDDGPPPRSLHSMCYDIARGKVVVAGGREKELLLTEETWEWESATGAWLLNSSALPLPREDAAMVYDSIRQTTLLFGGMTRFMYAGQSFRRHLADLLQLPSQRPEWTARVDAPSSQGAIAMVFDAWREVTVLIGFGPGGGQTWAWDGHRWKLVTTGGPVGQRAVFDSNRGVTVLFCRGLNDNGEVVGQTWEWDGNTWKLESTTGPSQRWNHGLAYDAARGVTVLFGGTQDNLLGLNDTWEWDGNHWIERIVPGPTPREGHAMAYDTARERTVVFGGHHYSLPSGNHGYSDTWEWDGISWTQPNSYTLGIGTQWGGNEMTYDPMRSTTVMLCYDEVNFTLVRMWDWNGTAWKLRPYAGPQLNNYRPMVVDPIRRSVLLFVGESLSMRGEFWRLPLTAPCVGDGNGDGQVNSADLLLMINSWGACTHGSPCPMDLNEDGSVNVSDLTILIGGWG